MTKIAALMTLIGLCIPYSSQACLHFDQDYKYVIREGRKLAFLYQEASLAHLIVKTDVRVESGSLPETLAWVMPFPKLPEKYEEVDPSLFLELGQVVPPSMAKGVLRGIPASASIPQGIKVHDLKVVGNYRIQPIEILSDKAGHELDDWLLKNHFNSMPAELQKAYLKKGAVFLAIQMKLTGSAADLKPIHIAYRAQNASFPLKFTHDHRIYDLDLFVFTSKPLSPGIFSSQHLQFAGQRSYDDQVLSSKEFPQLHKFLGDRRGIISKFEGRHLNSDDQILKKVAADPELP